MWFVVVGYCNFVVVAGYKCFVVVDYFDFFVDVDYCNWFVAAGYNFFDAGCCSFFGVDYCKFFGVDYCKFFGIDYCKFFDADCYNFVGVDYYTDSVAAGCTIDADCLLSVESCNYLSYYWLVHILNFAGSNSLLYLVSRKRSLCHRYNQPSQSRRIVFLLRC